jgi:hypothetical protein
MIDVNATLSLDRHDQVAAAGSGGAVMDLTRGNDEQQSRLIRQAFISANEDDEDV